MADEKNLVVTGLSEDELNRLQQHLGIVGRDDLDKVFAYKMRDEFVMYGAVKTNKMRGDFVVKYICDHLRNEVKQIEKRLADKRLLAEAKQAINTPPVTVTK